MGSIELCRKAGEPMLVAVKNGVFRYFFAENKSYNTYIHTHYIYYMYTCVIFGYVYAYINI